MKTDNRPSIEALAYDVPSAGRLIGVGTTKAWELVRSGELATVRIGRRRLVTRKALHEFVDRLSVSAA